jgi:L,D-peptidoglycan transpeptidase YkuD (ErfK/YbiS/YcfS/YnhG family)
MTLLAASSSADVSSPHFRISASADELIVVSSPTYDPPHHTTTFRAYRRVGSGGAWHLALGPWPAEIGFGGLRDHRHEGDGSTPTGAYTLGTRIYGNRPNPGRLHYAYRRLTCGDWWDEDPYSPRYNRFVHVPCGVTPSFAAGSEALWTETVAYP